MSFELSAAQMEHISLMLSGLAGNEMHIALANAANRAMQSARTEAWNGVKKEYTLSRTAFYRQTKVRTFKASKSNTTAGLSFNGNFIPLFDFKINKQSQSGNTVRYLQAEVKRGYKEQLKSAYVANLGKYGEAVFERATPRRDSSEQLMGPAAAEMVANDDVMENITAKAGEVFVDRIEHEVERFLRGY